MEIKSKLIGDEEERAVSPVIGVILMVAITVILAAVIAAFVLDLGQSQSSSASASAQFDEDSDSVTTTLLQIDRGDAFYVQVTAEDGSGNQETYWVNPNGDVISSGDRASAHEWEAGSSLSIATGTDAIGNEGLTIDTTGDTTNDNDLEDADGPYTLVRITLIGVQDGSDTSIQSWEP